ncbi:MAG: hypothetical protein A3B89_04845 [Candidatus Buchananbacteria bacterium RIFCSPHIGHO2_02_FULL_40_13]|nr:MAG: hypothetical protein A3B89_04845 [Candidatus Buchananbacteria bacterium RIFCSPHIGHO2_02_FULL_40_13]
MIHIVITLAALPSRSNGKRRAHFTLAIPMTLLAVNWLLAVRLVKFATVIQIAAAMSVIHTSLATPLVAVQLRLVRQ